MRNKRFYFDYVASTPVDPRVEKAMRPYFLKKFGNAGSLHSFGQETLTALDTSRETVANAIGADFREIIFTGSATEANNLAFRGTVRKFWWHFFKKHGKVTSSKSVIPHIIATAIEHESVLETLRDMESRGTACITILPVNRNGIVDLKKLKESLDEHTVLVSVMYANNEIGVIQPIAEIARIIKEFSSTNNESGTNKRIRKFEIHSLFGDRYPLFHTDAVQAFQFLDCNVDDLGVDMMTLSAHKIYGPKGIGALYVRNPKHEVRNPEQIPSTNVLNHKRLGFGNSNLTIVSNVGFRNSDLQQLVSPIVVGGGQEFGLRSGTENIPLIVGFAKAVKLVSARRNSEFQRIKKLKDYFWRGILKIYPGAELNGGLSANNESSVESTNNELGTNKRIRKFETNSLFVDRRETYSKFVDVLPNILNIYFPDYEAQYLLTKFDLAGIAVSVGSACSARSAQQSYVITALGFPEKRARHSIRFSFGRPTTQRDIDSAVRVIRKLL